MLGPPPRVTPYEYITRCDFGTALFFTLFLLASGALHGIRANRARKAAARLSRIGKSFALARLVLQKITQVQVPHLHTHSHANDWQAESEPPKGHQDDFPQFF